MMLRIGITGGIGSGKTTVCAIFELLGVPVFYADNVAKRLMRSDGHLAKDITGLLGEGAYDGGELQRAYIASKVFNNPGLLSRLNALVHPAVHAAAEDWFIAQKEHPYAMYEAALIFEARSESRFHALIAVTAPKRLRIRRVRLRDGLTTAQVESRMERQMDQWEKARRSDFVIRNNEKRSVLQQVMEIHQTLLHRASSS